ncbi:MAG TPA: LamG domain-containing protein [Sedimentisphaerales bacterium]|nr:LamG domain-containing protein [Sedimentisphaerales bacterium]
MCKKVILLMSVVFMLALVSSASAYSVGVVLRCDAGTGDLQAGWTQVEDGWNLNVNGTGIGVKLETGDPGQIEERDEGGDGPLAAVETDFYFADDRNTSPDNDFILTVSGLANGAYRLRSYHNRSNEAPVPIPLVTVTGASSVISVPTEWYWQNHLSMTIPLEVLFTVTSGQVVIRYKGPDFGGGGTGQVYFNGFILEYFGAQNQAPYDPDPADQAEQLCSSGIGSLSWTAGASATSHDIYFSTDINDVDPYESPSPVESGWGSTSWTPPSLELGTTYYWRVDEDTGSTTWEGAIWRFTTNNGNAFDPYPGDGWRGVPTDVNLSWSPGCDTDSHNVYLGTNEANVAAGTGGTFMANQPGTTYDPALIANTTYYWRIEEVRAGPNSPGEVWSFRTSSGVSGAIMYFKFDNGPLGAALPGSVVDSTGNETFTKFILNAGDPNDYVRYGVSNPAVNAAGGFSAEFSPEAGLYRNGKGPGDLLALDGYQYTVELWFNANEIPGSLDDDPRGEGDKLIARGGVFWSLEVTRRAGLIFVHMGSEGDPQNRFIYSGKNTVRENEWYHGAAVFDMTDENAAMKLYLDGQLMATAARPQANPADNNEPTAIGFQRAGTGGEDYFDGLIDEVRVSNVALTVDEFLLVPGPEWARSPYPANNERRVDPNIVLSWVPGTEADTHDVYLGTDYDDVVDATTADAELFLGNVGPNSVDPYGGAPLNFGTRYYWRVDELGTGGPWTGVIWSFTVASQLDDPNMILWYRFDETSGYEAFDSSGHDYFGLVDGDEDQWDPDDGDGGCRIFDDDTVVEVPADMLGNMVREISIAVWLKDAVRLDGGQFEDNWLFDCEGGGPYSMSIAVPDEGGNAYWRAGTDGNDVLTWNMRQGGVDPRTLEDWHHWVFIKSENVSEISIYFDGELVDSNGTVDDSLSLLRNSPSKIGVWGSHSNDFVGKVDDFMVFDYALPESRVQELFRRGDVALAWKPVPFNGQQDVRWDANLMWQPGDYADTHDVYFGTSWDDVNSATTVDRVATKNLGDEEYDPGQLELGQTYYWRIDEVNNPDTYKGKVWSFTVAEFVTLDDFEQYDLDQKSIQYTWYDQYSQEYGQQTGAWLELAQAPRKPVYRGEQAMSYTYDTDDVWASPGYDYAEAWLPLEEIGGFQDWTSVDVRLLTVFFYGQAGNDATEDEQMYIAVDDTLGAYAEIRYGDNEGEAWSDIQVEEWQRWDIPFIYFSDGDFAAVPDDVNFSSIANVYIGFGNKRFPVAAGKGVVFFDDLLLSMPICKPEYGPAGDLDDDCIIGMGDVGVVGEQWLRGDVNVKPVEPPSDANLVAHWKLDGNANDSSANHYHGAAQGAYEWVAGKDGQAIDLAGGWVVVDDNGVTPKLRPKHYVSVMAWVYIESPGEETKVVIKGEDNEETFGLEVDDEDGAAFIFRDANNPDEILSVKCGYELQSYEWIHIAGTYDQNEQLIYVNGVEEGSETRGAIELFTDPNDGLGIGGRYGDTSKRFDGRIDDVRVYDRAVTRAEIAYLACGSDGICLLESEANLFSGEDEEVINFKDFAMLMESWGVEQLWPPEP